MARDVLTELHGKDIGLDKDRALVIRSGIIRTEDGSPVSFPDGIDGVVGGTATAVDEGGTGITSYTIGDILYASATDTFTKLAIGTESQVLRVAAGLPAWSAITSLGTVTTGTWQATEIGAIYGGTGQSSWTRGQMLYASGTNTLAKLSPGAANTVLTSDGADPAWSYPRIHQSSQPTNYTLELSDGGGHLYHPSSDTTDRQWTIPNNSSVAFPIGTAITFVNDTSAGVITIAMVSDTLVMAGTGSTGSRTLAANGIATAIKVATTRWMISGTGLT